MAIRYTSDPLECYNALAGEVFELQTEIRGLAERLMVQQELLEGLYEIFLDEWHELKEHEEEDRRREEEERRRREEEEEESSKGPEVEEIPVEEDE